MLTNQELIERAVLEHGGPCKQGETFIYFVQSEDGGPIKIGRADDPASRLKGIQTGNPFPLRLTRVVIASPMEEWRLHRVFSAVRLRGEWFKPHPALAFVADAIADESLGSLPLTYNAELPYDLPVEFLGEHLEKMRSPAWIAELRNIEQALANGPAEQVCGDSAPPWRTITYRPEPDEDGWKESSADVREKMHS